MLRAWLYGQYLALLCAENVRVRVHPFRPAPGLGERAIFRERFPAGLILLDMTDPVAMNMTMCRLAARRDVRDRVVTLDLPGPEKVAAPL